MSYSDWVPFLIAALAGALLLLIALTVRQFLKRPPPSDSADFPQREYHSSLHVVERTRPPRIPERYWLWQNLTARETEIARLVAEGKRNADVARELHITPRTVDTHLRNIYSKLKIHSRTELANVLRELNE